MTTYAFNGAAFFFDALGNPQSIDNSPNLFEVVVPDGTPSLSYTLDTSTPVPTVDVQINDYTTRLNGVPFSDTYGPFSLGLTQFDWLDLGQPKSNVFLELIFDLGAVGFVSYGYAIIGDPMPVFNTVQEFYDFAINQVTYVGAPLAPYLPDTPIPLSALAATVTEDDLIQGTAAADLFDGGIGDDQIFGFGGNDILEGGSGADLLDGGTGADTALYDQATGRQVIDLIRSERNTGEAAQDTLVSIENLTGGDGSLDILGGTVGRNVLKSGALRDVLFGRGGDDVLFAGDGNDVLLGGEGADYIDGGAGTDRAQYAQARAAVTVDLMNAALNSGEAAGDRLISIEDIFGSDHDDSLSGDTGANTLFGDDGTDRLTGRAGDDFLFGGAGNDVLLGGDGNDTLRGGAGIDTLVYDGGADLIGGWRLDRIRFDKDLWGGTDLSKAQILAFASVIGGDTVFDFGSGNTLTVEAHTDLAALERWIDGF